MVGTEQHFHVFSVVSTMSGSIDELTGHCQAAELKSVSIYHVVDSSGCCVLWG